MKKNMINFYQKQDNVKQAWSLRPRFSIALASKTNSFWNEKKNPRYFWGGKYYLLTIETTFSID